MGLICDQPQAAVLSRAESLGVPSVLVPYGHGVDARRDAERRIADALRGWRPDLIALAGFMRIFSPDFVRTSTGRIINIHPIVRQETLARREGETLAGLESRIHALEHQTYPAVIRSLLDALVARRTRERPP